MFTLPTQAWVDFKKQAAEEGRVLVLIFIVGDGEIPIGYLLLNWMLNPKLKQMYWSLPFTEARNLSRDMERMPHRGMALHKQVSTKLKARDAQMSKCFSRKR